jgi:hypothetical protein
MQQCLIAVPKRRANVSTPHPVHAKKRRCFSFLNASYGIVIGRGSSAAAGCNEVLKPVAAQQGDIF